MSAFDLHRRLAVPAWQLTAGELGAAYAAGTLDAEAALDAVLARAELTQPHIHALVAVDADGAREAARASAARWRAGTPRSPLDGVPLTVKDNIAVAGLPCTWGSRLYAAYRPAQDETPVARLRAAGAVIVGKTNVPEFTLIGYTANALHGITRNPWDRTCTPGGSSGGAAAAVAAGIGPIALGTDGGGSIRRPAGHTGLAGLKPSWGAVPRAHGLPEILPGFEVAGPLARSVGDLALALQLLADAPATPQLPPRPLRIAHWRDIAGSPVDAGVSASIDAAAEALAGIGHRVERQDAPRAVADFNTHAWPVIAATGLAALWAGPLAGRDAAQMTPEMQAMLERGRRLSAVDLFEAQARVQALRAAMDAVFARYDAVLTPAAAAQPWPAGDTHPAEIDGRAVDARGHAVFTAFANACGLPALALPAQPVRGLPCGLQLVGPHGADAQLLALGLQYESHRPWRMHWPALA